METKHTTGPWLAHQGWSDPMIPTNAEKYPNWCEVTGPNFLSINGHFGIANARLIAAAPDLLNELDVRSSDLVMLRKAVEAGDPKAELLIRIEDMLRETRAAIAKATGAA